MSDSPATRTPKTHPRKPHSPKPRRNLGRIEIDIARYIESDVILVDKPAGITSFDIIRILRRKLKIEKIGHAGTLDPLATGAMILGVGKGTKKLKNYVGLDKTYVSQILLGKSTTTGDHEGTILQDNSTEHLTDKNIRTVIADLPGTRSLPVPKFSAIKKKGAPLYKRAHRGDLNFTPPNKEMTIHLATLEKVDRSDAHIFLHVTLHVSSGTYIRSIAEEIGRQLSTPAMLHSLRRTSIGSHSL